MDLLILDFSKAFDTVAHQRLALKLEYYGIRGETLTWINNWLTGRVQQVVVDGDQSNESPVRSGVPQGTVLGPLMFILYINDIGNDTSSSIRLFADDCLLYRRIASREDSETLQRDLDQMCKWAKIWQMNFNPGKCSVLRVTLKRKPISNRYIMCGETLSQVQHHPYLGVELSHNLSWAHHVNIIAAKGHRILNFLRRTDHQPEKVRGHDLMCKYTSPSSIKYGILIHKFQINIYPTNNLGHCLHYSCLAEHI